MLRSRPGQDPVDEYRHIATRSESNYYNRNSKRQEERIYYPFFA
ncbi:hypothetical protein [Porphyromonas gulae]|nr:hypothetical protein [Porphyromonas gulae]